MRRVRHSLSSRHEAHYRKKKILGSDDTVASHDRQKNNIAPECPPLPLRLNADSQLDCKSFQVHWLLPAHWFQ